MIRKTLEKPVSFEGIGIHSGQKVHVDLFPVTEGTGVKFIRRDVELNNTIILSADCISEAPLGSTITSGKVNVKTLEHFMAVLSALGITDLRVEMDGEEMPILDGSGEDYWTVLNKAGQRQLTGEIDVLKLNKQVWVSKNGSSLIYFPYGGFKISYFVDYYDNVVGKQQYTYEHSKDNFAEQICGARTFCFFKDVQAMQERGLALGGSLDNALVIYDNKYSSGLRYENEPVRHKILDLIGDLYLLGLPLQGHIVAIKSSHALNGKFAKTIYEEYQNTEE